MYFHIDESGNTGNDLFNQHQPRLSYGLLSSRTNVEVLGTSLHRRMLKIISADELHAKDMGANGIKKIAKLLEEMQNKIDFRFDYYFIDKAAYALVFLFDAVFDAGINPAVMWASYWTPMRFVIIHKLGYLMDEDLLRKSWSLCIDRRIQLRSLEISDLLREIRNRALSMDWDSRSKEVLADALSYGIANPLSLDFGYKDRKMVSPNAVGFQFVVSAMASRLRSKDLNDASSIIVDMQAEFNGAQIETHRIQRVMKEALKNGSDREKNLLLYHPLYQQLDRDEVLGRGIPKRAIHVADSSTSIGLQVVDVYLWLANRMLNGELPNELHGLAKKILRRSNIDGISMAGMRNRFEKFISKIPEFNSISEEQIEKTKLLIEAHRSKVRGMSLKE